MLRLALLAVLLTPSATLWAQNRRAAAQVNPIQREYQAAADRIIAAATADSAAWNKLAELTDGFGHRISLSLIHI